MVQADSPERAQSALEWAQRMYEQLRGRSSASTPLTLLELGQSNNNNEEPQRPLSAISHQIRRTKAVSASTEDIEPTCPEHGEMAPSTFGGWYCPAKDGERWCKYKIK